MSRIFFESSRPGSDEDSRAPSVGGFPAKYAGQCGGCGQAFGADAIVKYDDDDVLIALRCCAGLLADDPIGGMSDDQLTVTTRQTRDMVKLTMPRGASVKDRCPLCFQIYASNGTCSCD